MSSINTRRIQRQIVAVIVEAARLNYEAQQVVGGHAQPAAAELEVLKQTAERVNASISALYRLLPRELLPTAATLQAIEIEQAVGREQTSPEYKTPCEALTPRSERRSPNTGQGSLARREADAGRRGPNTAQQTPCEAKTPHS